MHHHLITLLKWDDKRQQDIALGQWVTVLCTIDHANAVATSHAIRMGKRGGVTCRISTRVEELKMLGVDGEAQR